MFASLPQDPKIFMAWTWPQIAPYYDELLARPLTAASVSGWLADWSRISELTADTYARLTVATTANTADETAQQHMMIYLNDVMPPMMTAEQQLKQKLIASGLSVPGFELPLRKLRAEADLFREDNVRLLAEQRRLMMKYDEIIGGATVTWEGKEVPLSQLYAVLRDPDRSRREAAYRTLMGRVLQENETLATLWQQMIMVRGELVWNTGFSDFRAYRWQQLFRFDYTPEDNLRFHESIERVMVPAAQRRREKRRQRLGIPTLRHWDLSVDPSGRPPLHPYQTLDQLETKMVNVFRHVDPKFAEYFETMRAEALLDLDTRPNKAAGGYSLAYPVSGRPMIFTNSIGTHGDVQVLLHEGGHAFHTFESAALPYFQQKREEMVPIEFAEVASMAMELLGLPYLTTQVGGFYSEAESARAQIEHLEGIIGLLPYMAAVDALQHWIYTHPEEAADIHNCDAKWAELIDRFLPGLDWSGAEAEKKAYWHRQSHIFQDPFYFVEYGIAQLGAVQVWANFLYDPVRAVADYRKALALGGTVPLPELYAAAGIKFAFDVDTLQSAVDLIESTIVALEPVAEQTSPSAPLH
ncbi:MAG: M3 family oligoendopeptidase [Aggregatilineales bacterium]